MRCDEACFDRAPLFTRRPETPLSAPVPTPCAMMCLHAEQRALRMVLDTCIRAEFIADGDFRLSMEDLELVHVKVDARGKLVPSGPPSCWQCAKEIAECAIFGVWLYEQVELADGTETGQAQWNFYPTKQFYDRTLKEVGLERPL